MDSSKKIFEQTAVRPKFLILKSEREQFVTKFSSVKTAVLSLSLHFSMLKQSDFVNISILTCSIKYSIGLSASSSAVSMLTASDHYCHSSVIIRPALRQFGHQSRTVSILTASVQYCRSSDIINPVPLQFRLLQNRCYWNDFGGDLLLLSSTFNLSSLLSFYTLRLFLMMTENRVLLI